MRALFFASNLRNELYAERPFLAFCVAKMFQQLVLNDHLFCSVSSPSTVLTSSGGGERERSQSLHTMRACTRGMLIQCRVK